MGTHSAARRRRPLVWVAGILALVLVGGSAAGVLAWRSGHAQQWWDRVAGDDPAGGPAEVSPPPSVDVPAVTTPRSVARPALARGSVDRPAVDRALDRLFADRRMGPHVLAAVAPLRGDGAGRERIRGGPRAVPASTTKLVTSAVALHLLGADHRFTTRTALERGDEAPRVVLVGGGDPYLEARPYRRGDTATIDMERRNAVALARRTAARLADRGVSRVRLAHDATLFTGPGGHPTWRDDPRVGVGDYLADEVIAPVSALWVDQGRPQDGVGRVADPPRAASRFFADQLRRHGIRVQLAGPVSVAPDAQELASVTSPPLAAIVARLLEVSDNAAAEVLLRHIGLAAEGEGSFAAGERGVRRTLASVGIGMGKTVLHDGSGLSRENRASPGFLVEVIRWAADPAYPELRAVLTSLPVAGYTGSLTDRFAAAPRVGLGRVRAKTGTLTGVSSLAGVVTDRDGHLLAFALMADRIAGQNELTAQSTQDAAAAALAGCRCG